MNNQDKQKGIAKKAAPNWSGFVSLIPDMFPEAI